MVTFREAIRIAVSKHSDSVATAVLSAKDYWIVALKPKSEKKYVLDPYFKVNKRTGRLEEYSTTMNPKEFKTAPVVYSLYK